MKRLVAFLLLLTCSIALHASERILDFHSDIVIAADGTLTVSEHITANAEGNRIQRGIYRDFPTDYRDRYGNRVQVLFEPLGVERDGKPEPWHSERRSNGVRVYFGDKDVYLDPGEHRYTFRYRVARELGYFEDHDELYWNVTGNGWDFTIDSASASVSLPAGQIDRERIQVEGYTGAQGSRARKLEASVDGDAVAQFRTTAPLPSYNGLTIVVSFPKGIVTEPNFETRLRWFVRDNLRAGVLIVGLIVLVLFLYSQWLRVGRDPRSGPIIAQYESPDEMAPSALRYVREMGYDDRCYAADLVALGVSGAISISKSGSTYSVKRIANNTNGLPKPMESLFQNLFAKRDTLEFKPGNHAIIGGSRREHEATLKNTYAKANFDRHEGIGCLGGLICIAAFVAAFLLDPAGVDPPMIVLTVFVFFLGSCVASMIEYIMRVGRNIQGFVVTCIGAVILTAAMLGAMYFLSIMTGAVFAVLTALIAMVQVPFARWMRAPTPAGRKLLDRIDGLRMYLGVAERDDLARAKEPPMSVDQYQRLLPHAIALNVESTWGDRLAEAIGPAAVAAVASSMAWYRAGHDSSAFNPSNFGSSLSGSLSSAISSSSTAPGSSSGGGGGGSSGGGGGGGGGGGW